MFGTLCVVLAEVLNYNAPMLPSTRHMIGMTLHSIGLGCVVGGVVGSFVTWVWVKSAPVTNVDDRQTQVRDRIEVIEINGQIYEIDRSATSAVPGRCVIVDDNLICRMSDR